MKKFFKVFSIIALSLIAALTAAFGVIALTPPSVEFSREKLVKIGDYTKYYDGSGNEIQVSARRGRYVAISDIPLHTQNAFIAIEDKNFYKHRGIDYKRIVAAAWNNLKSRSYSQGASTISQQLIKNTHLNSKKTLKRKIDEIKLTKRLEKTFSKDKILEMYLNTIYFGEGCYGIGEAAKLYFSKEVCDLTAAESATLAAIIVAPSKLNPRSDMQAAIKRRNLVLDAMEGCGYLSTEDKIISKNEDIKLNYNENYEIDESYINAVNSELNALKEKRPYLFRNCNVYTKFNPTVQNILAEAMPEANSDYQAMAIDNDSGSIIAYYSTCGKISRSPASTVKPWLVYAPCLEEGIINRYSVINDEKTSFGGYSPKNYGDKYYGNVSAEKALKLSLNVPAVKLMSSLTVQKAKSYAEKMGVRIDSDTLGVALGSFDNEIPLSDALAPYVTLANFGRYKKCSFISKITDSDGNVIYESDGAERQVFSEGTASIISEILKETAKTGTARSLAISDFDVAAKTGTNGNADGNLDAYSVSYTSSHTFGVWLGNADKKLMDNKITGSSLPTLSMREILSEVYADSKPAPIILRGVVTKDVDKYIYDTTGELLLADKNAPKKYVFTGTFAEGTEPKTTSTLFSDSKLLDCSISLDGDVVSVNYTLKPLQAVKIYRTHKGVETLVFDGNGAFKEILSESGVYGYSVVPYLKLGKEEICGEKIILPEIKITESNSPSENKEPPKENWWNDEF